jgi:Lon protease-like protein
MEPLLLPLFPLPDVVHFPGTALPLHVFEPRYRRMVEDLLERPEPERRVGMILTARDEETGVPELLEPGCAGRLVSHEALDDGRSNIVLLGEFRFTLDRELPGKPYRRALVHPLAEEVRRIDWERADRLERELVRLIAEVATATGAGWPLDLAELAGLGRPGELPALVNRLAAGIDLPALRKQTLLAEPPLERAEQLAGILRSRLKLLTTLAPFRQPVGDPGWN